jgi:lipoprotein-releasing system permease protein
MICYRIVAIFTTKIKPDNVNLPVFIANRLSGKDKENLSGPVIRIAVTTIALGIAVMIVSVAVLVGFQSEIRNKVIGFAAHIRIDNYDSNESYEAAPVSVNQPFYPGMEETDGIRHIQVYALKAGIIKTPDQIHGVVFKGVGKDFDWEFFRKNMVSGSAFSESDSGASDQILISEMISRKLNLHAGDEVRMYFISSEDAQPRGRKFYVSGIYETGLEEFDQVYVIGDLRQVQRLNNWTSDQVSGFEVFVDDFKKLNKTAETVYQTIGYNLNAETITNIYPQIFDWLRLMDVNVVIILVLMVVVAGITIISTLLIMILERTSMIGILKALGTRDRELRKLFLYLTARIIGLGLLWGNIAGIGLALIQYFTHIIPLEKESYYIAYVPVSFNITHILLINAGTFLVCLLMVLIPGYIIGKITPVRAIRYQ